MLMGAAPPRCFMALKYGENLLTRCRLKPGHNGPHLAKGLKKYPYQKVEWFKGDSREFLTDKEHEYAWSEKKSRSSSPTSSSSSSATPNERTP
jgi:hypothetical protein